MASLYSLGGLDLLHAFKAGLLCLVWLLLLDCGYRLAPQKGQGWICGLFWAILTIQFCHIAYFFDVRAYLFTYLFLATFWRWLILEQCRPLWIWAIVVLLWANLHAGVIIGLFLLGAVNLLRWSGRFGPGFDSCPSWRGLSLLVLVSMFNPSGATIYLHLFKLTGSDWGRYLNEWQSLWKDPTGYGAFPWFALLWSILLWRSACPRRFLVVSLLFAVVAFSGWRHITLYGWMMLPLVVAYFPRPSQLELAPDRSRLLQVIVCLSLLARPLFAQYWGSPQNVAYSLLMQWRAYAPCPRVLPCPSGGELSLESSFFPRYAADFLVLNRGTLKGKLFNFYGWGGYLIFRLSPDYSVFIDGRAAQVYSLEVYREYLRAASSKRSLAEVLKGRDIHLAVLMNSNQGEGSRTLLADQPDWKLIYEDDLSCIFSDLPQPAQGYVFPPNPRNLVERALGESNPAVAQNYLAQALRLDASYTRAYLVQGVLLLQQGNAAGVESLLQALEVDPLCSDAHFNLGLFYRRIDAVRARAEFEAELRINPNHAAAQRELQALMH